VVSLTSSSKGYINGRNSANKICCVRQQFHIFFKQNSKGKACYSEEQVISMLEFVIDNIFVSFGRTLFQQLIGIPMGTNYCRQIRGICPKMDVAEAVSVVSLTSSSGGYINGRNSANLELLIDKTSSIYLYVKLKALAS
jgi:hypothetical protein